MRATNSVEKEDKVFPFLIQALRQVGGRADRTHIFQELRSILPDDLLAFMDQIIMSKNRREYRPFNYTYGFSMKHLMYSGFVKRVGKGIYELTEKGRTFDLAGFNPVKDVRELSQPIWDKNVQEKHISAEEAEENIVDDDDEVLEDETWKLELISKLRGWNKTRAGQTRFETFSRALVSAMGVDIDELKGITPTGDGGLDGFGYLTSDDFRTTRVAIQSKCYQEGNKVGPGAIRDLIGTMDINRAEFGIFITTSDFTKDAITAAREGTHVVTLINSDKLLELVEKYQLYIKPINSYKLGEFYTNTEEN